MNKLKAIFGLNRALPMEVSLYRTITLLVAVLCLLFVLPVNLLQNLPLMLHMLVILYGISSLLLFINSCRGRHQISLFYVMTVILLSAAWFLNGGTNGSIEYFMFATMLYPLTFFRGWKRVAMALLLVLTHSLLVFAEHLHPSLVTPFQGNLDRVIDLTTGFLFASIALAMVFWTVLTAFEQELDERRKADELLSQKDADIEQFLYSVSHDLRTPLVTVKTFTGYLERDLAEGNRERVAEDFRYIHDAADKMKAMLDELLQYSRIDRIDLPSAEVHLSAILSDTLKYLAGLIHNNRAEIRLPETDLILFGERPRLMQIFQNLIENAIKYGVVERGIQVEIGIKQQEGDTVFYVKDNGIGIDPRYLSRIFRVFEKLDPASPGVGLGLTMVQRIVEKYDGRIWIESSGDGKGSCVLFTLPHALKGLQT